MRSATVGKFKPGRVWPAACALLVLLAIPGRASATVLTYVPSAGAAGVGNDLGDLDHHYYYAWTIGLISIPAGQNITSAYIAFTNLYNWDTSKNVLYMDLLAGPASGGSLLSNNTGINSAGDTYTSAVRYASDPDVPAGQVPVTNFADAFDSANALNNSTRTDLTEHSFLPDNMNPTLPADIAWLQNVLTTPGGSTPTTLPGSYATIAGTQWSVVQNGTGMYDYTYTFTAGQLAALSTYIGPSSDPDRDITLAFDPDCHFFNDGVSFSIVTATGGTGGAAAVPEPASLMLLGTGLLLTAQQYRRRRAKKVIK